MKICPKCKSEHEKSGKYCGRICANSRVWTDEQKAARSEVMKDFYADKDTEFFESRRDKGADAYKETVLNRLLTCDFSTLGHDGRRKRVLIEQDYKCNKCGLVDWLGEPISLEMDHIDGNKKNNVRSNLECLCPNCHAQTPTWRGKKRV